MVLLHFGKKLFLSPVRPELLWEALSAGYLADVVEKILRDNSAHNIGGVSALFALNFSRLFPGTDGVANQVRNT